MSAVLLAALALQATAPAPVPAAPVAAAPVAAATPIRASKVILIGDSTMQVGSGWGGAFCADHVTSFLACVDLARGGRSSGSYRAEGSWNLAVAEMKTPGFVRTWVLIQFGHNDQPGKPGRSTDLATEFPANLRRYVTETRAAGAIPVLVTPLSRRTFKDGKVVQDLALWAEAVRKVAREMQVPLVDLNARSTAALDAMGERQAETLAEAPPPPPGQPVAPPQATEVQETPFASRKPTFDRTHLGARGVAFFSRMVARDLAVAVPDMAKMLYD